MGRRTTGTIERRGPDYWRIRMTADGRTITRYVRGDRSDAERARARLLIDMSALDKSAGPTTLRALIADRLDGWTGSKRTVDRYRSIAARIPAALLDMPVDRITATVLDSTYRTMAASGRWTPHTLSDASDLISPCLKHAAKLGMITTNPAAVVRPPTPSSPPIVAPTDDVVRLMLASFDRDDWASVFFALAAVTGARVGELCALRWYDVAEDCTSISITRSARQSSDGLTIGDTKTSRRGHRPVAVDAATAQLLATWRDRQRAIDEAIGRTSMHVWATIDDDRPLIPGTASLRWRRKAAELDMRVRLHDLRHYAATTALRAGVPAIVVSRRAGHSRIGTTIDMYGSTMPGDDADAADIIAERLRAE